MTVDLLQLVRRIAEIPAPTFGEAERGRLLAGFFRDLCLPVEEDEVGNVWTWVGHEEASPICFAAHLDTVFPDREVRTRVEGERLYGKGVADDAAGLAVLVALAAWARKELFPRRVFFLADVGEEGLGNLRGVRAFLDAHRDITCFVSLDGRLGTVVCDGIGVRRLGIRVQGPGGHSWGDFGRPSAIHALVHALEGVLSLKLPASPRTTLNIGTIAGGTSVNAIAAYAEAFLDLRSTSPAALSSVEAELRRVVARELGGLAHEVVVVGERPAACLPKGHPLAAAAETALKKIGIRAVRVAGSTDANYPLALGIPAIAFGVVEAEGAHTAEECLVIPSLRLGFEAARQLLRHLASAASSTGP